MKRLTLALVLSSALLAGCGGGHTSPFALGSLPTSPAGVADMAPPSYLQRLVHRAREFRGNPIPLAVLTGTVLLVALAFGVYTILVAYREPPAAADRERRTSRAA